MRAERGKMEKLHGQRDRRHVAAVAVLAGLLSAHVVSASAKPSTARHKPSNMVTVRGTVVNAAGKPVYGVRGVAELVDANGKLVKDVNDTGVDASGRRIRNAWTSGNGGKFVIRLRPGTYKVWAEGARRSEVTLVVPGGRSSVSVRVLAGLPAGYVKVYGTVVTVDGKPVEGVNGRTEPGPSWVSHKDGKFTIDLLPGTYRLWALAAKSRAVTLVVPRGKAPVSVRVVAKRMKNRVPLKFLTPEGTPAADAQMGSGMRAGSGSWGSGRVSTDASGILMETVEYDAPVWFFFAASGIGYATLEIADDEMLFSDEPITVQLSTGPYVSGFILAEPTSIPLGGVKVYPRRVYKEGDPWSRWNSQFGFKSYEYTISEAMSATSRDGDGSFTLGPVPPGDYKLVVGLSAPDNLMSARTEMKEVPVTMHAGQNVEGLKIAVSLGQPAYSVQGRALRPDGVTPLASSTLIVAVSHNYAPDRQPEEWYVWEPVRRSVVTDAQGNFSLYPVSPGKYKLEVTSEKLSAIRRAVVHSDRVKLDFVLAHANEKP